MSLMFSSYRKTKKGSIVKVVRECYLRDDIHCGRESCTQCKKFKLDNDEQFAPSSGYLVDNARLSLNKLYPKQAHYIVPDFNTVTNQIDVIADPTFGNDVIILQTIWKRIKSNINVYSKLKELISSRRFYLFDNEFFRQTFRCRNSNETIDEYRENLCREACEWLQKHFTTIHIIYLIDSIDNENVKSSDECHFRIHSIADYVQNFHNPINLMDKLSANVQQNEDGGNKTQKNDFLYDEHLPLHQVLPKIKSGQLHKGCYHSNRYNFLEGTVTVMCDGEEMNVHIEGRANINRAINEDIVAIEILPRSEWKSKIHDTILDEELIGDDDGEDESMIVKPPQQLEEKNDQKTTMKPKPFGRIVAIIRRNWRSFCGVIREPKILTSTSSNFLFVPVDKRIPFIRIETRQYQQICGKKILVRIDCWPRDSRYPRGHYSRVIGESGDKETETNVLLLEHLIPHMEFSAQVLNCLPVEGDKWQPRIDDLSNRSDFRQECVVSVDPPGCTDIDDALHCKDLGNNQLEVGVHIADVTHFIRPGSAIDREAAERGTTVYLADRRIDMVPGLLSSNLCSLICGRERLSFSCVWKINSKTGEIYQTKFSKSIIQSRASLTYAEAQTRIDDPEDQGEIAQSLRRLNSLAKILRAKRIEKGALVLASANEIRFVEVESETAENELVILEKQALETNSMIEEFMLLANISVAEKIYEIFPELAVLRRHPKPAQSNFEELIVAARNRGFDINVSDGKSLSASLNSIHDPSNEHLNLLFRMITTRCMSQALYFCSGSLGSDPNLTFFHYGLASEIYTHFTSPIRRYADVLVHRLLSHAIDFEQQPPEFLCKRKITDICDHINMRNMNARRASRSSNELHSYLYVRNSREKCCHEKGHVFTIKNNALVIFIMHLSFEVVYMFGDGDQSMNDWQVDKDNGFVIHKPSNVRIRQFDPVQVELTVKPSALTSNFKKQIIVRLIDPKIF
ncbi:exosome complex exonuclease RRP44-like protein Dis3 [Dermatophagoides farinae]|uniref:Protein DIS3 homolog n=1 Tax=Dermatophagoides farinae TaxID=6954 RepID=A0A9D4P365_DERFA|nr:exosome complex exonuclease RRP44-like [Dermatophagoides farinae]KAH7642829.1 exosome complex exonuclease rrp44-like protein [Dermatophagoides farinae]